MTKNPSMAGDSEPKTESEDFENMLRNLFEVHQDVVPARRFTRGNPS